MLNSKENEKIILNALKKYGCLQEEQLVQLVCLTICENKRGKVTRIKDYPREYAQKAILNLYKKQYIWPEGGLYLEQGAKPGIQYWCLSPYCQHDEKIVRAFWLFLQYVGKLPNPDDNFCANSPSEILFLKNNSCYEIMVLRAGEENRLKIVFNTNRANSSEEQASAKYFIITEGQDSINKAVRMIPEEMYDKVMFATMKFEKGKAAPAFEYFAI